MSDNFQASWFFAYSLKYVAIGFSIATVFVDDVPSVSPFTVTFDTVGILNSLITYEDS